MLDEATAADAVAQWAGEVCEIPAERRFSYPQAQKTQALPDVAAAIRESRVQRGADPEHFPLLAVENVWVALFVVEFSLMVEQGSDEAAAAAAQDQCYGFAKALREAVLGDASLRGELDADEKQFASPIIDFDFAQPFIEYPDGTRGRVTPGVVRVAEAIPEPA